MSTVLNMDIIRTTPASTSSSVREITLQNLHTLVVHDDWNKANKIFNSDSNTKTAPLNQMGMTALHLAARSGNSNFVMKLVRILTREDLLIQDQQGRTALHYAASSAELKAVKALVERNPDLVMVEEVNGYTPLFFAARWGNPSCRKDDKKVVNYLYHQSTHRVYTADYTKACNLIAAITASGCYSIVCRVLDIYPRLALAENEGGWSLIRILASQPRKLLDEMKMSQKESIYPWMDIYTGIKTRQTDADQLDYYEEVVHHVCKALRQKSFGDIMEYFLPSDKPGILQTAIICEVPNLVKVCLRYFPDLIWYSSPYDQKLLLHVAVEYRNKELFDHILYLTGENMGNYAGVIAHEEENNILHLAAKLAPTAQLNRLPGPAFQMQRELQWFRKVESMVYSDERMAKNKQGKTGVEVLFDDHSKLLQKATEWMKDAAESGMIIAVLVATVAFAAMITLPGGNDTKTGMPVLYKTKQLVAFSVAISVSMISSAFSLLLFLTIQISKYRVEDFIVSLPQKLIGALLALFVAVATMMLAFGLAIGMAFHTKVHWSYIPITLVACIPAIVFPIMQVPLLYKAVKSTITEGFDWSWRY